MSNRKGSKKPVSKKTAALIESLERRRGVRELAKRFLIVCEDDKSAPNYFHALKKHFNLSAASIEVVGGGGDSQPIQVVRRAVDLKESAEDAASGTGPFDEVWCVIDGDYGHKIHNARTQGGRKRRQTGNLDEVLRILGAASLRGKRHSNLGLQCPRSLLEAEAHPGLREG